MMYLTLFWEFFKTGLFAVGGGLATLPFLSRISDTHPDWFSHEMLADMIAVSESTPGPIGVNMATYGGFHTNGILGAVVSTLGLITPSVIIILIIAGMLEKFNDNKYIQYAFNGLRPAVAGLIAAAGFEVLKISVLTLDKFLKTFKIEDFLNIKALILFVVLFALLKLKKHPVLYIAAGAIAGIVFSL